MQDPNNIQKPSLEISDSVPGHVSWPVVQNMIKAERDAHNRTLARLVSLFEAAKKHSDGMRSPNAMRAQKTLDKLDAEIGEVIKYNQELRKQAQGGRS